MRSIAPLVHAAVSSGTEVAVARVMEFSGFGGRRSGDALIIEANGVTHGTMLLGAGTPQIAVAANRLLATSDPGTIIDVPVGDTEAVAAGLACGGSAKVIIQRSSAIPVAVWSAINDRVPEVLATPLAGPEAFRSFVHGGAATTMVSPLLDHADKLLRNPKVLCETVEANGHEVLLEAVFPKPQLVVLGVSELADAMSAQARLLGWDATVFDERSGSAAVAQAVQASVALGPHDGCVVLSHDIAASTEVMAAAIRGRCGYVGALGSRHTQAARAERLRDGYSMTSEVIARRVHGPVGLDLGARTPEETALAIFAEWLAVRGGRVATSLRVATGPING
jgi:xanthine dehydrogenase accessory factor